MLVAVDIFDRSGLGFLSRWAHIAAGVVWIGLLYYFNFVQVPAFAEMEAGARTNAVDKLASRALWWFRWGAAATLAFGLLLLLIQEYNDDPQLVSGDYFKTGAGVAISTGVLLGVTMFLNVWLVIWPNQKKVIANARNVAAGGEADPSAADAGRRALLASRQNVIFSFTMLLAMVGTAHWFGSFDTGSDRAIYWIITLVVWAFYELNALGVIGGFGQSFLNWGYENHQRAIIEGLVLAAAWYVLWELVFD